MSSTTLNLMSNHQQTRHAFKHILQDMSVIIFQFQDIAAFMAGIDRLFLFMKAIQELDVDRPNEDSTLVIDKDHYSPSHALESPQDGTICMKELDDGAFTSAHSSAFPSDQILVVRNLRLMTPDKKRILIHDMSLSLPKGRNLLIAGR